MFPILSLLKFSPLVLICLYSLTEIHGQCLLINELQAANKHTIADGFGENEDWIELFNCGDTPINIGGMYFSDNPDIPNKHQIPKNKGAWTTIAPKDRMLLWVDSDDEQGSRHLSFRLDDEGGTIAVYNSEMILLDRVDYKQQSRDKSFGRKHDGSEEFYHFETPTPKTPNIGGVALLPDSVAPLFSEQSGFYKDKLSLALTTNMVALFTIPPTAQNPILPQASNTLKK